MTYRHHSDGGRLRPATVDHDHVIHHSDGSASAIVVRGVPAVVCEFCDAHYYDEETGFTLAGILQETVVKPGEVTYVDWPERRAA